MPDSRPQARPLAEEAIRRGAAQKPKELSALLAVLRQRRLRTVVEIGTAQGGTLFAWCQMAEPEATVISIDLQGGPFGGGYSSRDLPRLRSYARQGQRLEFLRRDSHQPSTLEALRGLLDGVAVDFLFIDGDHTYDGVRSDFEMYSPLVKENGLIAFHDIVEHTEVPSCQVDRYWRELRESYQVREFIQDGLIRHWGPWGGIGLVNYRR